MAYIISTKKHQSRRRVTLAYTRHFSEISSRHFIVGCKIITPSVIGIKLLALQDQRKRGIPILHLQFVFGSLRLTYLLLQEKYLLSHFMLQSINLDDTAEPGEFT